MTWKQSEITLLRVIRHPTARDETKKWRGKGLHPKIQTKPGMGTVGCFPAAPEEEEEEEALSTLRVFQQPGSFHPATGGCLPAQ